MAHVYLWAPKKNYLQASKTSGPALTVEVGADKGKALDERDS